MCTNEERKRQWEGYRGWLERRGRDRYNVIIDGANLGYFKQNAAAAGELADLRQVDWAVKKYQGEVSATCFSSFDSFDRKGKRIRDGGGGGVDHRKKDVAFFSFGRFSGFALPTIRLAWMKRNRRSPRPLLAVASVRGHFCLGGGGLGEKRGKSLWLCYTAGTWWKSDCLTKPRKFSSGEIKKKIVPTPVHNFLCQVFIRAE